MEGGNCNIVATDGKEGDCIGSRGLQQAVVREKEEEEENDDDNNNNRKRRRRRRRRNEISALFYRHASRSNSFFVYMIATSKTSKKN